MYEESKKENLCKGYLCDCTIYIRLDSEKYRNADIETKRRFNNFDNLYHDWEFE